MDSPHFSERSAPQTPPMMAPRFTEHINNSPPYPTYQPYGQGSPPSPQYAEAFHGHSRQVSDKESPGFPDLYSPGLESVMADEGDKEVAMQYWSRPEPMGQSWSSGPDRRGEKRRRTVCGLSMLWVCILLAVVVALGVGLGAGLGVGLKGDKSSSGSAKPRPPDSSTDAPVDTQYLIGGAISPSYYSTEGAFNGSGIAVASQSFAGAGEAATQGSLVMYFQHWSGDIRWAQLSVEGKWLGGSSSEVVAVDAKNNTPLSAVAYSVQGVNYWHLFYIDQNNYLRQRSNGNETNVWSNGTINDLQLKVLDADQLGMQACWYGSDYGDSDYIHTPLPSGEPGSDSGLASGTGMHMWYASSATTFEQYGWRFGDTEWLYQGTWDDKNGHAGVGCYSWGEDHSTTYAMFVNTADTVEIWWRDTMLNHTNTTTHPLNEWTNSSLAINGANPATSLGFTNYLYWQDAATNMIQGVNISFAAENSSFVGDVFTVADVPGISGTHFSVSALPDAGGGSTLTVFFQVEGTDVTEFTRDWIQGQWTSVDVPIDDT